jgi:hypothetical protein
MLLNPPFTHAKRLRIITALIFCFITIHMENSLAQAFSKGEKVIGTGIKISIYSVNAPENNDPDEDGPGAASFTIPITFEYALTDHIGLGAEVGFANFFTEEDTITRAIAEASSFDLLFTGDYHWVRGGKVDLCTGLGLGFSSFQYESNDHVNSRFESTGFYLHLNLLKARFYIGNSFALGLNIGVPYMNFDGGRIEDDLGTDFAYPLSFSGVDLGATLSFKF